MTFGVNYRTSLGPKHRKLYIFEKLRVLGIQLNEKKNQNFHFCDGTRAISGGG